MNKCCTDEDIPKCFKILLALEERARREIAEEAKKALVEAENNDP